MPIFAVGFAFVLLALFAGLKDAVAVSDAQSHYYDRVLQRNTDPIEADASPWEFAQPMCGNCHQWLALVLCAGCYYLGITQPLVTVKPPKMAEEVEGPEVGGHSKSNLELIGYLYGQGMPVAALMIVVCSLLIPASKFAVSLALMLKTRRVPQKAYAFLAHMLTFLSPYQFIDAYVVLLLLAYLNFGASGKEESFSATIAHGFWFFLVYCLASVLLAQVIEADYEPLPGGLAGDVARGEATSWGQLATTVDATRDRKQVGVADFGEDLVALAIHLSVWCGSWLVLSSGHRPPLELQFRVSNIVAFVREPDIIDLHESLLLQSVPLTNSVMVIVFVMPVLYAASVLLRSFLVFGGADGKSTRKLWLWEQLLRPWVMGDVVAVGLSAFFLSIQEPDKNFIMLCVKLPNPPVGLFAFLSMGVAAWGVRGVSPPLHPEAVPVDSTCGSRCTKTMKRLLLHYLAYVFWCLLLWQFGPRPPLLVHDFEDVNDHLSTLLPTTNKILRLKLPPAVGRCDLAREENKEMATRGLGCEGNSTLAQFEIPMGASHIDCDVEWAEGLDTLTLDSIVITPKDLPVGGLPLTWKTWSLRVAGHFTELKVWIKAMNAGHVAINAYECCPNPYHFSLEGLASCSDETGFEGEIRVGTLHLDDIEQDTDFNPSSAAFVGFQMDLMDKTLLKKHLKEQMENMLNGRPTRTQEGETVSGARKLPFQLTNVLNTIVRYNSPDRCPRV